VQLRQDHSTSILSGESGFWAITPVNGLQQELRPPWSFTTRSHYSSHNSAFGKPTRPDGAAVVVRYAWTIELSVLLVDGPRRAKKGTDILDRGRPGQGRWAGRQGLIHSPCLRVRRELDNSKTQAPRRAKANIGRLACNELRPFQRVQTVPVKATLSLCVVLGLLAKATKACRSRPTTQFPPRAEKAQ